MILQPFKFDANNFPKKEEPLSTNMKLIGSVYYHIVKEVITEQYLNEPRDPNIFKVGNWLSVKK